MGVASEEAVVVKVGRSEEEASVITVNCPDRTGLGCDLCWVILEYGLRITRGDVSTDGRWCYMIFWVIPRSASINVPWANLKNRLLSICPSFSAVFYLNLIPRPTAESLVYLLKFSCTNQKGLLHDVTHVLCELELLIHRVKVSTTPDGRVVDLFFFTDGMELMHTKVRQEETISKMNSVLGKSCEKCEIQLAGPEYENFSQRFSPVSQEVAEKLFSPEIKNIELFPAPLDPVSAKMKTPSITIDNLLSPTYTLLQIHCVDQKSILYDILRTLKDCDIHVAYNRCLSNMKGSREVDLFVQQKNGRKIVDPVKQNELLGRLRMEMLHPLRVIITSHGPDTELLVANPVEMSGKGRPRVFYDVTFALRKLGICIFLAEIGRHSTPERQWEIYRFLLDESCQLPLADNTTRNHIMNTVRKALMGW